MLLFITLACAPQDDVVCAAFASTASSAPTVLHGEDSCGWWSLALDDQLVVSVELTEPDVACAATVSDGLEIPYEPAYSNLTTTDTFIGGPKWTYQVVGAAVVTAADVEIVCDEGTGWAAKVNVVGT